MIAARFRKLFRWCVCLLFMACGIGTVVAAESPRTLRHLLQVSSKVSVLSWDGSSSTNVSLRLEAAIVGAAPFATGSLNFAKLSEVDPEFWSAFFPLPEPEVLLWFEGDFSSVTHPQPPPPVLVHVRGRWFGVRQDASERYRAAQSDLSLNTVWNGGTDMLREAIAWMLRFPKLELAGSPSVTWEVPESIGAGYGGSSSTILVDLHRTGSVSLFIPSRAGDTLLQRRPGDENFTNQVLGSRSAHAVWGDFDGDGRLDLASAHGNNLLSLWLQLSPGTFSETNVTPTPLGRVQTMAVWAQAKRTGLLIVEDRFFRLLARDSSGRFAETDLFDGSLRWPAEAGVATGAVVADFDGDSWPDILQICANALVIWPGNTAGKVGPPTIAARAHISKGSVRLADFNADGKMDVLLAGHDLQLWHNQAPHGFREVRQYSGELPSQYQAKPWAADVGDFNNDGWPDIVLGTAQGLPRLYSNRGFRSFIASSGPGVANGWGRLQQGQEDAVLTDVDNDGAQELVFLSSNVMLVRRVVSPHSTFSVRTILARDAPPGPVMVQAFVNGRPLGAWPVTSGGAGAFFGLSEPGPVLISWQFPGHPKRSYTVVVEEGESRLWLRPDEAVQF